MARAVQAIQGTNIMEGAKTEEISRTDLAQLRFCTFTYHWTRVTAKWKNIRETLENIKASMTKRAPKFLQ